jgi:hypothetical protein
MKYDLIILTAAVNRSLLHNESFSEILKILDGLKCKWIIHINKALDEPLIETDRNLKRVLKSNNIDLDIKLTESGGTRMDFYNAIKYLANEGSKYKSKFGVLLLEDDWKPIMRFKLKDDLLKFLKDKELQRMENAYIGLVERDAEVSFNPGIWSTDIFEKFLVSKINEPIHASWEGSPNPERVVVYPKSKVTSTIKNLKMLFRFKDIGREWMRENKFRATMYAQKRHK